MGKAEENKSKKRTSLLTQAYELFTNNGISNTSIADIASSAGVGKGTFYSYFKDKDDLIDRLIGQKAETLLLHAIVNLQTVEKNAGPDRPKAAEDKVIFIINDLITQLNENPKLVKFLNKRLNYGFYKKAYTRDNFIGKMDINKMYHDLIFSDGSKWKNEDLMLYTLVEFLSSTLHSVITEKEPVDLETYKPYLFGCVRNIMDFFKIKEE